MRTRWDLISQSPIVVQALLLLACSSEPMAQPTDAVGGDRASTNAGGKSGNAAIGGSSDKVSYGSQKSSASVSSTIGGTTGKSNQSVTSPEIGGTTNNGTLGEGKGGATSMGSGGASKGGAASRSIEALGGTSNAAGRSAGRGGSSGGITAVVGVAGRNPSGGTKASAGAAAAGRASGNGGSSEATAGQSSNSTVVENESADCPVATLPEGKSLTTKITKLPDPFTKIDGKRVATKEEWRCRRQEIRKQAEKYIFGEKPTPEVVSGSVTKNKISVHVEAQGKKIDFAADLVLPTKGQAPYPALISVGAKGGMGGLTMGESRILDMGVAVIYYDNYQLGQEGTAEQSRGKPNPGKFYDIYGGNHSAGLLMAWAWGASRMLDVIQQSGGEFIDITGIGVTGCSRLGKGAFAIGVFDDRIALTIPQEPSTGGDPALRIMDVLSGAERTDYNYKGLNWLSNNFEPFVYSNTSNAVKLPIDTHALVGMMAPRGVLVLENPHQTQMGAPAGHMATLAGAEVYKALGVEKNVSYHSSVSDTAHCSYKTEYTDLLTKSIAAFMKHEGTPPGQFLVGSNGSVKQADWMDWKAPTLE